MAEKNFRFWRIPNRGAIHTRELVRQVAKTYGAHPLMRKYVVHQVLGPAGVVPRDQLGMARAIHGWVRDRIAFVNEAGESVLTPGRVLLWRYGDCDDRTGLVAAMLEAVRIPWRLQLLCRRRRGRLVPFHIWPQARIAGRWHDLETSHSRSRFAEHPANLMRRLAGLSL